MAYILRQLATALQGNEGAPSAFASGAAAVPGPGNLYCENWDPAYLSWRNGCLKNSFVNNYRYTALKTFANASPVYQTVAAGLWMAAKMYFDVDPCVVRMVLEYPAGTAVFAARIAPDAGQITFYLAGSETADGTANGNPAVVLFNRLPAAGKNALNVCLYVRADLGGGDWLVETWVQVADQGALCPPGSSRWWCIDARSVALPAAVALSLFIRPTTSNTSRCWFASIEAGTAAEFDPAALDGSTRQIGAVGYRLYATPFYDAIADTMLVVNQFNATTSAIAGTGIHLHEAAAPAFDVWTETLIGGAALFPSVSTTTAYYEAGLAGDDAGRLVVLASKYSPAYAAGTGHNVQCTLVARTRTAAGVWSGEHTVYTPAVERQIQAGMAGCRVGDKWVFPFACATTAGFALRPAVAVSSAAVPSQTSDWTVTLLGSSLGWGAVEGQIYPISDTQAELFYRYGEAGPAADWISPYLHYAVLTINADDTVSLDAVEHPAVKTWAASGGDFTNDLTATNAAASVLHSDSRAFVASDVNRFFEIVAGTNALPRIYKIVSVGSGDATLNANCTDGVGAMTAGSGILLAALAADGQSGRPLFPQYYHGDCIGGVNGAEFGCCWLALHEQDHTNERRSVVLHRRAAAGGQWATGRSLWYSSLVDAQTIQICRVGSAGAFLAIVNSARLFGQYDSKFFAGEVVDALPAAADLARDVDRGDGQLGTRLDLLSLLA